MRALFNTDFELKPFHYFLLGLVIFFAFFYGFASYAILNMNEGLYAEIPREMLLSGNYIIPHLNFVPYIEKPPLLYWLIALSYKVFGVGVLGARLIPVVSAAVSCLTLVFLGRKTHGQREGWLAGIVLASSVGFIVIGRVILFDMLLTAFMTLSLSLIFCWYTSDKKSYLRFAYAFLGLALMTKGYLPLVLEGGIVALFFLIEQPGWKKFRAFFDITGIFLFIAIVLPWHIAAIIKQPGFAYDYFINEQLMRFFNKRIPLDYHTGPFYFYLPRLFVTMLPWSFIFPALFFPFKRLVNDPLKRFLCCWFLVPLIIFSLSQAKGDYYMVLGMPPLAYLLALRLKDFIDHGKRHIVSWVFLAILLLEMAAIVFIKFFDVALLPHALLKPFEHLFVFVCIYSVFALSFTRQWFTKQLVSTLLIAGLAIPLTVFYVQLRHAQQYQYSEIKLGQYIQEHHPQRRLYLFENFEKYSSLVFYSKKRVAIIQSVSQDLYYGSHTAAGRGWFISDKQFKQTALKQAVYVAVRDDRMAQFLHKTAPVKFCRVYDNAGLSLLTNVPGCSNNLLVSRRI